MSFVSCLSSSFNNNIIIVIFCTAIIGSSRNVIWRETEKHLTVVYRNSEAEPNSEIHGKYIRNNLIRIQVSLICKLSGTPN
jgi:hypothetical protein